MPPLSIDRRGALVRRLALCCAVLVLAVSSLSAAIRQVNAGLGCSPWPQCQGQMLRDAQAGKPVPEGLQTTTAAVRLMHRVAASLALLLAIMLVMVCFGTRPVLRKEGVWSLILLGLALGLSVLGIWSRGARVPAVTLGNLLGGFAMLAVCVRLVASGSPVAQPGLRAWALAAAGLLLLQLSLGGLLSAGFAGASCSVATECSLLDALQRPGAWQALNPWRDVPLGEVPATDAASLLLHSLHRHLAGLVVAALLALATLAWRRGHRTVASALVVMSLAQLGMGWLMVLQGLPLILALAHNALASLLLSTVLLLV